MTGGLALSFFWLDGQVKRLNICHFDSDHDILGVWISCRIEKLPRCKAPGGLFAIKREAVGVLTVWRKCAAV
jgi:hypothetical protein